MNNKPLRSAFYGRYSTDGQLADSIDRQFMVCESIAKREGFVHDAKMRFSDPDTSGGTPRRVGYNALLAAALRREFDVVIAEDISRLWRNMEMQTRDINELLGLGIAIVTQAEDTRRENDLMMLNIKGSVNENNRKEIGRRVRNKLELLAKNRRPAGGRPYGYIPATVSPTGQIEIDPEQATIVRQIFEWRAAGWSGRRIAQELNQRGVIAPGAVWKRDPSVRNRKRNDGKWMCSAIVGNPRRGSGILNNPIYRGDIVWGRSRWVRSPRDSAIRKCELVTDPAALVSYHEERLRIVNDDAWARVAAVQCARTPRSEAISRARRRGGRGPVYWLSSVLVCGYCGSNYVQYGRSDYVCSGYYNGGSCSNAARFRIADIERSVVDALKINFLSDEYLASAADIAAAHFEQVQRAAAKPDLPQVARALQQIAMREAEVRDQFKSGKLPNSVFKAWLAELDSERRSIRKPATGSRAELVQFSREVFLGEFRKSVSRRLKVFTSRVNVAKAREALRELLSDGRVVMKPDLKKERFVGTLVFNHQEILEENQIDIKMVAGACFEATKTQVVVSVRRTHLQSS